MRITSLSLIAASSLLLFGQSAGAVEFPKGFYAGASIGVSQVDTPACEGLPAPTLLNCDDQDAAFKLLAGYQFWKWLGLEASYFDLGDQTAAGGTTNVSAEVDGYSLAVTTTIPVLDRAGVFLKLGAFYWDQDVDGLVDPAGPTPQVTVSSSNDDTDLFWGFGVRLPFTERFGLGFEFETYQDVGEKSPFSAGQSDIELYSLNFLYSF